MTLHMRKRNGHILQTVGGGPIKHLSLDCSASSVWYTLNHCLVLCTDCDESMPGLLTNSNLSSYVGLIIVYDGNCYMVDSYTPDSNTPTPIDTSLITAYYDTCEECCGNCLTCGSCEFSSTGMTVTYSEKSHTCYYTDDNYTTLAFVKVYKRDAVLPRVSSIYDCSPNFGASVPTYSQQGFAADGNSCRAWPLENSCITKDASSTYSLFYSCVNDGWEIGSGGDGVLDGTYPAQITLKPTACSGGTVTGNYYRSYISAKSSTVCNISTPYQSIYQYHTRTITLNDNECGAP